MSWYACWSWSTVGVPGECGSWFTYCVMSAMLSPVVFVCVTSTCCLANWTSPEWSVCEIDWLIATLLSPGPDCVTLCVCVTEQDGSVHFAVLLTDAPHRSEERRVGKGG